MAKASIKRKRDGQHPFLHELWNHKILYLMILPTLCYFILFHYLPMGGVYLAFVDFNFADGLFGSPLCGFDNFKTLFQSGVLVRLLRNTILYNVAFIFIGNIVQLIMAILLSRITRKWFPAWAGLPCSALP
jgi:putative aldouronate transport system permease protein